MKLVNELLNMYRNDKKKESLLFLKVKNVTKFSKFTKFGNIENYHAFFETKRVNVMNLSITGWGVYPSKGVTKINPKEEFLEKIFIFGLDKI
jgi:hypothetical protein